MATEGSASATSQEHLPLLVDDRLFDRMRRAVEKVEARMIRASDALARAGVPYAVVGGNAVAAWVATTDEAAVRNTRDVDMMLREADFDRARRALESAGFVFRHSAGPSMFLADSDAKAIDAVHIVFAEGSAGDPDLAETVALHGVRVIDLLTLVTMKLSVWRDKDRVHLRDMITVGLIDETWMGRVAPELAPRLRHLLENPE